MAPESFIGHKVKDLVELHNTNGRFGFRFFRLQAPDDTVGVQIVQDPTVRSAIERRPSIADSWIVYAEDYYGEYILRISSRRR